MENKMEQKREMLALSKKGSIEVDRQLNKRQDLCIEAPIAHRAQEPLPCRLLELPRELLLQIYEYLLHLDDKQTCHPAILRTCKTIHCEATSILYDSNVIEIRLHYDGVATLASKRDSHRLKDYKWSRFLRIVRHLRFCFRSDPVYDKPDSINIAVIPQLRLNRIVEKVFFSLCDFLHGTHNLRQFEVDVAHCPWAYGIDRPNIFPDLYAVRLIEQPNCNIVIHNAGPMKRAIQDPMTGVRRNAISHAEAREYMCQAVLAMRKDGVQRVLSHASPRTNYIKLQEIETKLRQAVFAEPEDYQSRSHDKLLLDFAGHVRRALCQRQWCHSKERKNRDFHGSIQMVLMCAVELKATLHEADLRSHRGSKDDVTRSRSRTTGRPMQN